MGRLLVIDSFFGSVLQIDSASLSLHGLSNSPRHGLILQLQFFSVENCNLIDKIYQYKHIREKNACHKYNSIPRF